MIKYKTLNLQSSSGSVIQKQIEEFVSNRTDIVILNMNIWEVCGTTFATILYRKEEISL